MAVYQTKLTREILARIEKESNVTWNSGKLPTERARYFPLDEGYLTISDEDIPLSGMCSIVRSKTLVFLDYYCSNFVQLNDIEFVEICKKMRPKDD